MAEEETKKSKKQWYGTWWGILIILAFWPVFLSYWIWRREWRVWVKTGCIAFLWVFILGVYFTSNFWQVQKEAFKEGYKEGRRMEVPTPAPTQEPTVSPKSTPSPTITAEPVESFDTQRGNNPVAAKYAQEFIDLANKAASGTVVDIFLELSPEDMAGKDEESYKKDVTSAFLTVEVDNLFWNSLNDSSRKDLVAAWVVSLGNIFTGGYPHVYVNNGIRAVAEGEYNFWRSEPNITLK